MCHAPCSITSIVLTATDSEQQVNMSDPSSSSSNTKIVDPDTGAELYRHTDLWFDDGSVVCRAEDMLFRVHTSQLARHSACFRDMFSLASSTRHPRPGYLDEIEGCPVIFLHDKAEDLANLLVALYDGPNFGDNGHDDFQRVSGILRLSTKYIIDSLREKALAHLRIAWPSNLKGWDCREDLARLYEMQTTNGSHLYPSPIAVINLAREVDAPSLLPPAFYDLCRYPFCQIFAPSSFHPSTLSLPDTQRLCLGKEIAQNTITTLIQAMGTNQYIRSHKSKPSLVCVSAAACRKDFSELVDLATQHYLFDRERGFCDPLYVAEELGQLKSAELSECKPCAQSLEAWAARERQKMWKMIPLWFRLQEFNQSPAMSPSHD
ncbi:hypothetical protein EDD18DRAFT_1139879 [Armillaria luteobubalina]|uniref:BTB domain-containing protein n=1 Tax=Armillaria luteobubalina TaxID=153913 RepID=A0AA39TWA4_9AGAR|nr:hypothetical protein EDD18DRAFT_1139879 [Armillaria luteobubalina]